MTLHQDDHLVNFIVILKIKLSDFFFSKNSPHMKVLFQNFEYDMILKVYVIYPIFHT